MIGLKKRDIKKALKAGAKAGGVSYSSASCMLYFAVHFITYV